MSAAAHARIALNAPACTSCMMCVKECPTLCLEIHSHQEVVSEPGARRPRSVNVLDAFTLDWGLCMYCGICVEVCPFDALQWLPDRVAPTTRADGLRHGISELDT